MIKQTLVALSLLAGVATPAAAVTVTFEGFRNQIYNAPITRSGFEFGNVAGDTQHFHEIDSTNFGLASNGTGVLLNDRDSRMFVSASDLSTFTLSMIDVAASFNNGPGTSLTIEGFLANVSTGVLTISNLGEFQTVLGTSLGNVDRLLIDGFGGGGGFELDNVVLNGASVGGVPEPTTWAMLIAGFAMTGSAMRNRARKATVA